MLDKTKLYNKKCHYISSLVSFGYCNRFLDATTSLCTKYWPNMAKLELLESEMPQKTCLLLMEKPTPKRPTLISNSAPFHHFNHQIPPTRAARAAMEVTKFRRERTKRTSRMMRKIRRRRVTRIMRMTSRCGGFRGSN